MHGSPDFLIIGGGIIGITLALEAKRRDPGAQVLLIEKESQCAEHASGRNSGVLHAGFYYSADSLKARFTRTGNAELTAYCEAKGLPINRCGKLVVARREADLAVLDELLRRGRQNGVDVEMVSDADAQALEPRARTLDRALFSPTTASVSPRDVVAALRRDAEAAGVVIATDTRYLGTKNGRVATSRGPVEPGYVVNAAGLYADRIARDYGFGGRYRIVPFKGLYLRGDQTGFLRTHVYPVPDLTYPFLGVHVTVDVDRRVKVGPTAIPALWREQYGALSNFRVGEFLEVVRDQSALLFGGGLGMWRLAAGELRKRSRRRLLDLASELVRGIDYRQIRRWGESGIRAQLYDVEARKLEMDFRYEGDDRSFHVLNAVSPAFTCALPFSRFLFERIRGLMG